LSSNFQFPSPDPQNPEVEALRQTLQAQSAPSEPAVSAQASVTPVPGTPVFTPETYPATPDATSDLAGFYVYPAQSGDTLPALAARFDVEPGQIYSPEVVPAQSYISPGQIIYIPWEQDERLANGRLLPDGEIINSPAALDFDLPEFIWQAGGYLSVYTETLNGEVVSGIEIVQRISSQSSINPRLLLAFLEYRSQWVYGFPADSQGAAYPIGFYAPGRKGLYQELLMTATQLNVGYYGWRQGSLLSIKFSDQRIERLNPALNAGSAALQHLFSKFYRRDDWHKALYAPGDFISLYQQMFGDPWVREAAIGPVIPAGLIQPNMELPFQPGERWSLTGGPHFAWDSGTPRGALDFSPVTGEASCAVSSRWATAVAPGMIARAAHNAVVLDLDGDGYEQTGWVLVYYHLAESELISAGSIVQQDGLLGHPSCEGGRSTGKHVHIVRKYNGEWLPADGPIPFVLSGWRATADDRNYQGSLVKDGLVVSSNPGGNQTSIITR
jgi:murein DD-endopeptidase MepM/ murein hydrolase activator NlpD